MVNAAYNLIRLNFLGQSPKWYKRTIVTFLIINPLLFFFVSPFIAGWAVLIEFIFTLACALKCYPLQPGGLLAIEAVAIGLTNVDAVFGEVKANVTVLLLLIFMVAGVYFLKDLLLLILTKLFLSIKKKHWLALLFSLICASLSAFLDALTIVAITIAVCFNFYAIYHSVASGFERNEATAKEFDDFKGFLRNIIIHGAVGTTIGGTMTIVGEPQNLMIGTKMGWSFADFFHHNDIISVPVAVCAFILCFSLEYFKFPGFGYQMPARARELITKDYRTKIRETTKQSIYLYVVQAIVGILLIFALAFHIAEVGLIGITLIVLVTAFTGLTKEHDLQAPFNNAMPFVTLLVVFFAILAVVHSQHLVHPLVQWVFTFEGKAQLIALYFTNGVLSFVSDNVFIASIFISEVDVAYAASQISQLLAHLDVAHAGGTINEFINENRVQDNEAIKQFINGLEISNANGTLAQFIDENKARYMNAPLMAKDWYERLAVVVNMGTNIPAIATPNGQAAFLFLLTSSLSPLLNLSYFRMFKLVLPYTIVMTSVGALAIYFFL